MQDRARLAPSPPRPRWSYDRVQQRLAPYVFTSPFFILFAIFGLFPLLFSLYLAFHLWNPLDGLGNWRFVGWENFVLALGALLPTMQPDGLIVLRPLGDGWYLYKTT